MGSMMSAAFFRHVAVPVLVVLVLTTGSETSAQRIPGVDNGPTPQEAALEYQLAMRKEMTAVLQDWTTLWERDQADALARYYTDFALLQTAEGNLHRGRDAIRQVWAQQLPLRGNLQAEFTEVLAGSRLAYAAGRFSYEVTAADGTVHPELQTFIMIFEQQRGRWLVRMQAFAPADESTGGAGLGRSAVRASRGAVYPPERGLARLVFEPFAGSTSWETQPQQAAWNFAGGALGLEFGRVLELRGHYWQGLEEAVEGQTPLRSYGGELRTYLPSLWRFQPQVLLGGSKLSGTAIPDRLIVPSAGAGMGFRVTNGVNLQFAARDYFPRKPDAPESEGWATLERSQQWMFSGGLSYALGRQPTWRDPAPPRAQVEHEAFYGPQILAVVSEWAAALQRDGSSRPSAPYTVTALLIEPQQGV
ncbi:hypothetical protein BH24GEM2_BH24GEM2_00670 [soil metagenome]